MGRHESARKQLQVLYLGSSAALGTLRRSMEAHGMVTRTRLTPAVDAVVADPTVPSDHPSVRAAASLGIPVLEPGAFERFAGVPGTTDLGPTTSQRSRSAWSSRLGHR